MSEQTTESGRLLLIEEDCIHCGKPSREGHPAGVIRAKWRCTVCRRWQDEDPGNQVEES
ncbi:MAG TPA: hypothetical protein VGU71_22440 [Candidatus Dormibacteraeota bacterium]|nr:hypothetical protein [Candidatus Dormibacteraeota bacterium]